MITCEKVDDAVMEETERESEEFVVTSDHEANWVVKKIKELTAENDRIVQIAKDDIAELQTKIELLNTQLESRVGFLKSKLYEYFQTVEHKQTKTQESYKLLDGSLAYKKPSQKMVPDKEKLLEYVKAHNMPEFVKVKEEFDWANYKKECEISDGKVVNFETGELLPDDLIVVEDVPGSFDIK